MAHSASGRSARTSSARTSSTRTSSTRTRASRASGNGRGGSRGAAAASIYQRRRILVGLLGIVLLVELFQILWPGDKFFPLATLDGHEVGGQSAAQAAQTLNADALSRTVRLTDQSTQTTIALAAKDAGVTVDYAPRTAAAAKHSFVSRIVPFSWLFIHNTTSADLPSAFGVSDAAVSAEVHNAGITSENGTLATDPAKDGYTFNPADMRAAAGDGFASSPDGDLVNATLNLSIVKPTISTETADSLRTAIVAGLGNQVTFTYGDGTWTLSSADMAGAIGAAADSKDASKLVATVDSAKLAELFKSKGIALDVAKKAADANAVPASFATEDRASRALDMSATADAVASMLSSGKSEPVAVQTRSIKNAALYDNLPTDGSIQDKLKTLFGNATYSVAVYDLKTGEAKLTIDADRVTTSASTYKLFIAHSMIEAVESGKLTWNSPLNGMTLNACLTTMIVNSDNACPEAWLRQYGFDTVTQQAHEIGANNTNFARGNMRTTANDLATVLKGYYSNTIATKASTDRLFPLMQTQVYREGIPTGIGSDGVVQDKVGFLNALLHDAAIVRCDKGDYAMVIMTEHSSWSKIAQASMLIYDEL